MLYTFRGCVKCQKFVSDLVCCVFIPLSGRLVPIPDAKIFCEQSTEFVEYMSFLKSKFISTSGPRLLRCTKKSCIHFHMVKLYDMPGIFIDIKKIQIQYWI